MCPFPVLLPFLVLMLPSFGGIPLIVIMPLAAFVGHFAQYFLDGVSLVPHRKAVRATRASREVTSLGFCSRTLRVRPGAATS